MIFPVFLLTVALSISAVAAYYSIVGLTAIFAAAFLPIVIMGTVLEIGKIVTTVWLHNYWEKIPFFTKSYLCVAVVVLMFITSMGIFGFLSKSHIEQTALSDEQIALIETVNQNINRSQSKIDRWTTEIKNYNSGTSTRVDNLVQDEQIALDDLYNRRQKEKEDARSQAEQATQLQNNRLDQAFGRKNQDIESANGDVAKIEQARKNELSVASSAQREITKIQSRLADQLEKIDQSYAEQIQKISDRIGKLRTNATLKTDDIDAKISELETKISEEQKIQGQYREQKIEFESEVRKLEAEVGPIKYIAEFIYDNANKNILEEAVRWVIIVIVFVFDPLAIMLVLAATMTFKWNEQQVAVSRVQQKKQNILTKITTLKQRLDEVNMEIKDYEDLLVELDKEIEEGSKTLSEKVDLEAKIEKLEKEKQQLTKLLDQLEENTKELTEAMELLTTDNSTLQNQITDLENREPMVVEKEVVKEVEDTSRVDQLLGQIATLQQDVDKRDLAIERLAQKYDLVEKARTGLQAVADDSPTEANADFGTAFPTSPQRGDLFLRVDFHPSRLYKWNSIKWIQVDKDTSDTLAYNDDYIEHVVQKLQTGEYDIEELSDAERSRVEDLLNQRGELGK